MRRGGWARPTVLGFRAMIGRAAYPPRVRSANRPESPSIIIDVTS